MEYTALLDSRSFTLGKVTGKGEVDGFIGTYDVSVTSIPSVLTAGKTATFIIDGSVTNTLGLDAAGETLRLSGLPGQDDATVAITYEKPVGSIEAVVDVPAPGQTGDTLIITLSLDSCPACVIQWVYRYG